MPISPNQLPTLQSWMGANLGPSDISISAAAPLGGTALAFDGNQDYVSIPYRPPAGEGGPPAPYKNISMAGDFTLELWVRASVDSMAPGIGNYGDNNTAGTYTGIMSQWDSSSTRYPFALWYGTDDSFPMVSRWGGTSGTYVSVAASQSIADGYYHRILVSRYTPPGDDPYLQLAVDARYWAAKDTAGTVADNELPITIGQCNGVVSGTLNVYSAFRGMVALVSLWNRGASLSASGEFIWAGDGDEPTIPQDTGSGTPTPASLAVGQWLLNEGYGTLAFDRAGQNHGRLLNSSDPTQSGPLWVVSSVLDVPRNVTMSGA